MHVLGVQTGKPPSAVKFGLPHLLKPPPPQKSGVLQVPHETRLPHPSAFCPQVKPVSAHVLGTHVLPDPPLPSPFLDVKPVSDPSFWTEPSRFPVSLPPPAPPQATAKMPQRAATTYIKRPKLRARI